MTLAKNIGIVGLGMMGGSLGAALVKAGCRVYGYDIDAEAQNIAMQKNFISAPLEDASELDALIVALTEAKTISALDKYVPMLKDGATVMDICGNKRGVVGHMRALAKRCPALHFVGTHPMAGRETDGKLCGIYKASASMFAGAYAVIVPVLGDVDAANAAKEIYSAVGARPIVAAGAEEHDRMISYTSQLAHILSSAYAKNEKSQEHRGFSAGSFLDLTRVARLDARMWAELFLNNRDMLLGDLDELLKQLELYRDALVAGDGEQLERLLELGNAFKDGADRNARAHREEQ